MLREVYVILLPTYKKMQILMNLNVYIWKVMYVYGVITHTRACASGGRQQNLLFECSRSCQIFRHLKTENHFAEVFRNLPDYVIVTFIHVCKETYGSLNAILYSYKNGKKTTRARLYAQWEETKPWMEGGNLTLRRWKRRALFDNSRWGRDFGPCDMRPILRRLNKNSHQFHPTNIVKSWNR